MDQNFDNSSYSGNNQPNDPYYTGNMQSNPQNNQPYYSNPQGGYNTNTYYSQDPNPQFYSNNGYQEPPQTNGLAIASLVCGIISIVISWCWGIGFIPGILAIIFGLISKPKTGMNAGKLPGIAIAGIICGIAGIIFSVIFFAMELSAFNEAKNSLYYEWKWFK